MEDLPQKNISGDKFSFPNMSVQSEFEFGSVTPGSPSSPADHIFSNGKLLPHSFPIQPRNSTSYSRSMSRTSSISSKDSFLCSRSNSLNSSSSSCSSARTSISTDTCSSEKKIPSQGKVASKVQVTRERKCGEKPVLISSPQYGSSQRWQFIAPMPALKHQTSHRKKGEIAPPQGSKRGRKKHAIEGKNKNSTKSKGFFHKIFMAFVSTCRECHAMNPSRRDSVLKENFKHCQ